MQQTFHDKIIYFNVLSSNTSSDMVKATEPAHQRSMISLRCEFYGLLRIPGTCTRGDQKVRRKVLLNRIAFIDCNENS